jgi:hypothetical protein
MAAWFRPIAGSALFLAVWPLAGVAQQTFPNVKFNGRLQGQFYYFDNGDYAPGVGAKSNFFIRRARLEARGQISENVSLFIQPSFEGGRPLNNVVTTCEPITVPATGATITPNCTTTGRSGLRLRDAWIEIRFTKPESKGAFYFRGGQEKRPYSRYELTSSNNLPSIERGAGQGLPGKASNDLFADAGVLSHDVGASARGEYTIDADRKVVLTAGVYNGQGESLNDVNSAKSFGFRGTVGVYKKLDIGGNYFSHDAIQTVSGVADSSFRNWAWGIDAAWGKPGDEGLYAVAEYLYGEDRSASQNKMRGIQGIAAYNIRFKNPDAFLYAIEPAFRYDYADPNKDGADDRVTTITAVLGFYFASKAQFRVAYERQSYQDAGLPSVGGVRTALTVNF